jgi:predicted RNA-binding protein associated with RNAse of E/G family
VKRKRLDIEHHGGAYDVKLELSSVRRGALEGELCRLTFTAVENPLWVTSCRSQRRVIDSGFTWLSFFRPNARNVPTAMFDADGGLVQTYIDVVWKHGLDDRGVPWYDDLYLDVVVLPSGEVELLDRDELDVARTSGLVSEGQYRAAIREADDVLRRLQEGRFDALGLLGDGCRGGSHG